MRTTTPSPPIGGASLQQTMIWLGAAAAILLPGAALAHTGGGKVTETEAGDEEGAYEVEVTMPDGGQVDVHLDKSFHGLNQSADDDGSGDDAGERE